MRGADRDEVDPNGAERTVCIGTPDDVDGDRLGIAGEWFAAEVVVAVDTSTRQIGGI